MQALVGPCLIAVSDWSHVYQASCCAGMRQSWSMLTFTWCWPVCRRFCLPQVCGLVH